MINERYKIEKELVATRSSTILLCEDTSSGNSVVLKMIPSTNFKSDFFYNEVNLQRLSEHKNVVTLLDSFETKEEFVLVLESGQRDLLDYVLDSGPLDEDVAKRLFLGVFLALSNMHKLHIIHHDIKLENLLLMKGKRELKIIDFGLSEIIEDTNSTSAPNKGTFHYLPPEIITQRGHNTKVDVWSLGISLFTALTGEYPFDGDTEYEYTSNVLLESPKYCALKDRKMSKEIITLLSNMLEKDPEKRISIDECLQSYWQIDVMNSEAKELLSNS